MPLARRSIRRQSGNDRILIDAGNHDQRIDASLAQDLMPTGGGGPENQPGHRRMCIRSCNVTRC